jgi:hypothetical protein
VQNKSYYSPHVSELLRFTEVQQRHTDALAQATGEHFNIFQILGIGHLEVKTHSPILGELLNPKGRHGQGAAFLRLFLSKFKITDFDAESETATIELEYYGGQVTEKSGGRIDIVVKDGKGSTILIENKIYAGDQENQMKRYRELYPKAHLFYLTLDRHKPSNLSEDELNRIQCERISYVEDILAWLNECRKEAACLPVVRETISQYIHLIKELTNRSSTTRMSTELIKAIVESKDSLAAFFTLCGELEPVRAALIARLDAQLDDIANVTGLKRDGPLRELHRPYSGFYFTTPGLVKCNLQTGCTFDNGYYGNFCYGFAKIDHQQGCPVEAQLLSAFAEQFPSEKPTPHWPAWAYWEDPYRFWRNEAFEAIRSGQFEENLKAKFEKLAKIARQVCPDAAITQIG